ncbi:MAG: hypothetical protein EB127_04740 [Alphaproteobacteria bacterium]|nr:hypothetical protein [Alphaproteobacteria bacterium]
MTQKENLISYLKNTGRNISGPQAKARFGIQNLRARMSELRKEGFTVTTGKNKRGNTTYEVTQKSQSRTEKSAQ